MVHPLLCGLAQAVKVTRGVAYFHNAGIAQATLVLGLWGAIAAAAVAIAWLRQTRSPSAAGARIGNTSGALRAARGPAQSTT
jgi:hypothetical protein